MSATILNGPPVIMFGRRWDGQTELEHYRELVKRTAKFIDGKNYKCFLEAWTEMNNFRNAHSDPA